jgi:short-subunit dehydrogenase
LTSLAAGNQGLGALIHVTSVEAKRSLRLQTAYAAAKHGVDGFLESLRVELMHQKLPISVTEIMPGGINTPLFNKARTKLGVKPQPTPPIYQPSLVAKAIVEAAENPKRDVVVGGAGKLILLAQRVSPSLVDAYMVRNGFDSQYTNEPKSENAPDNLFQPISGYDTIEGDFTDQAQSQSF